MTNWEALADDLADLVRAWLAWPDQTEEDNRRRQQEAWDLALRIRAHLEGSEASDE